MACKLVVRLKGGMGNQLFCYATARRLAFVNDAELVIDAVTGFKYDYLYRRTFALGSFSIPSRFATTSEQLQPFSRVKRFVIRKISQSRPLEKRRYIHQAGIDFDPAILNLCLQQGTTYFEPFGQSEGYFSDIGDLLVQDLSMHTPTDDINKRLGRQASKCTSVALHMRWFDPNNATHSSNIPLSYYAQAIAHMRSNIGTVHFFVFSDYPDQTETLLRPLLQDEQFTVVRHNAISGNFEADFWLMSHCQHFIIGNSTYAWWAAWLREQRYHCTRVVAPSKKIDPVNNVTAWAFPGLLPERWTLL